MTSIERLPDFTADYEMQFAWYDALEFEFRRRYCDAMKVITVAEAEGRLSEIIYAVSQGESIILKDGDREVCLNLHEPGELNLDEDSPELEAELLKAADGPFKPYSHDELHAIAERVLARHRAK
jgi:hypothetical protein